MQQLWNEESQFPFCQSRRGTVSIRDDNARGPCEIKLKRVDKRWSDWKMENIGTDSDYKIIKSREMVLEAAHGGIAEGVSV